MKTVALLLFGLISISWNSFPPEEVDILTAVEKKLISIEVRYENAGIGSNIKIEIQNKNKALRLLIPAGTRFKSEYADEQDLLTPKDKMIALGPNAQGILNVRGFCVQASNRCPSPGSSFTLEREKNENLVKLAQYMKDKEFDENIIQTSLWAVSDYDDLSGIYSEGNPEVEKLREYICSITNRKKPWYNTNPVYTVDEDRNIVPKITKVEGVLSYTVNKTGVMKMEVCKENGEVLRTLGGNVPVSNLGEYSFNFRVKVEGWESGKYMVRLKIGEEVIHKEDFEIT